MINEMANARYCHRQKGKRRDYECEPELSSGSKLDDYIKNII
jgi:hypothetical protein